ncbi:MAG: outer membrane beta-barrel protein, partial [Bacteroidota bacterium]
MQIQRFLFVSLLCLCTYSLWGQSSTRQTWPLQVGFGLAGNAYLGDYTETDSWMRRVYPGANFSLQKANPRRVQLQVNGGFGKFSDQFEQNPSNLPPGVSPTTFIETSFIYTDMRVKIRPWPYARLQPYLSVGAGFLFFTPRDAQGKDLPNRIDTRFLGEDYNTAIPQLPGGLGVQYRISRQFTLGLDYMYRFTPSDYLDNVGEAGTRNGFDALHGLQLTLYASLA